MDGGDTSPIPDQCVVAGAATGQSVLTVVGSNWASELELFDLTLTHGCRQDSAASEHGGGLDVRDATVYAQGLIIEQNAASNGGGLALRNATMTWLGGELYNNRATNGGGAWVDANSTLDVGSADPIDAVRVELNSASNGGGLYVSGSANLTSSPVSSNTASSNGGGLYVSGSANLTSSDVSSNTATSGDGGGLYNNGPGTHLEDLEFISNQAPAGLGVSVFVVGNEGSPTFTPYVLTFSGILNSDTFNNVHTASGGPDTTDGNDTCTEEGCSCEAGSC